MDERHGRAMRAARGGGRSGARRQAVDDLLDYQSGCWRRGERPAVNACLDRRPELGEDDDAVLDLICHEILLRARRGEAPRLEEYEQRFPKFAVQLQAHFEVHQAMLMGDSRVLRPAHGRRTTWTPARRRLPRCRSSRATRSLAKSATAAWGWCTRRGIWA